MTPAPGSGVEDCLARGATDRSSTSAPVVARFERLVRPRWLVLTRTAAANVAHGFALVLAGVLLMMALGLVPFSNTLPASAVLLCHSGCSSAMASSSPQGT